MSNETSRSLEAVEAVEAERMFVVTEQVSCLASDHSVHCDSDMER